MSCQFNSKVFLSFAFAVALETITSIGVSGTPVPFKELKILIAWSVLKLVIVITWQYFMKCSAKSLICVLVRFLQ